MIKVSALQTISMGDKNERLHDKCTSRNVACLIPLKPGGCRLRDMRLHKVCFLQQQTFDGKWLSWYVALKLTGPAYLRVRTTVYYKGTLQALCIRGYKSI